VIAVAVVSASFVAMEAVSYATHRWVMHGFARAWHRSHHAPARGRFERNDLFPLCFSVFGAALFAGAGFVAGLRWVAVGVTAYGACYVFVHDVYIHRRLPSPVANNPYLDWLRESHRAHHQTGGEPYGMLLPLVRSVPGSAARVPLERSKPTASTR
jgi:beta-carotene 3-hydroxylase